MSVTLLSSLLGLAILDSVNPSAIAATVFLMTQPGFAPKAATYVAGVFVTYFVLGVAGVTGLDLIWGRLDSTAGHALVAALGAVLLGYALVAPDKPAKGSVAPAARFSAGGLAPMALLGAVVTIAEVSTAVPYVAAVSLLADSDLPPATWLGLLAAYNVIFVAPPMVLIAAYLVLGERIRPRLERWEGKISAGARTTMLWLMGALGFVLLSRGGLALAIDMGWVGEPGAGPA